jgi:hypothetical protein
MQLEFITRECLDDLKANFKTYKKHYVDDNEKWFSQYFENMNGIKKSKYSCDSLELDLDDDFNVSDLKNIKILHSALIDLPLEIASDERLWSGLAHGAFREYVRYRRKEDIESLDDQKIKNSFFFTRGIKRSNHIHCISRLWWAGNLTYNKLSDNPYELTELLFKTGFASTLILLSSRNYTANKKVVTGLLKAIQDFEADGVVLKCELPEIFHLKL